MGGGRNVGVTAGGADEAEGGNAGGAGGAEGGNAGGITGGIAGAIAVAKDVASVGGRTWLIPGDAETWG